MSAFQNFWEKGYQRLLPVIPASQTHIRSAGKRPGNKEAGYWQGTGSSIYDATQVDIMNWEAQGASVGLRTDGDIIAIDIDVLDREWSEKIVKATRKHLGNGALRIGREPKALLMFRVTEPMKWRRIRFDAGTEEVGLVELLAGDTKWFVVDGIHPKTHKPYRWPNGLPSRDELPVLTPEQVTTFLDMLERDLPEAKGKSSGSVDRSTVDQNGIKAADIDLLRNAMEAVPNDPAVTGYEEWVQMAVALRGACQDDPNAGLDMFIDWSEKAPLAQQTEDPERVYWSLSEPFGFGDEYIYGKAKAAGWYNPDFVEDMGPEPVSENSPKSEKFYPVVDISELVTRKPARMLVARHIPEQSMGFVYGAPGSFKSFMTLDLGLHLAAGRTEWHGDALLADPQSVVVYLAFEGAFGMRNRILAWCKAQSIAPAELAQRFKLIEVPINFMKAENIQMLMATVRQSIGARPCLIVVDTVSRALPGADENMQKDMTLFVHACDALRAAFACAVVGVHHTNKNGGEMRGSTVLLGAGDFVFRMSRQPKSMMVTLDCEKQKDAEDGWGDNYALNSVALDGNENSLVLARLEAAISEDGDLTPATADMVWEAMRAAWEAGEPWTATYHGKDRFAVTRMMQDFRFKREAAESALKIWIASGQLVVDWFSRKANKKGLRVVGQRHDVDIFG